MNFPDLASSPVQCHSQRAHIELNTAKPDEEVQAEHSGRPDLRNTRADVNIQVINRLAVMVRLLKT